MAGGDYIQGLFYFTCVITLFIVALQNAIEQYCKVMKSSLPIKYGMLRQVRKLLFLRLISYILRGRICPYVL